MLYYCWVIRKEIFDGYKAWRHATEPNYSDASFAKEMGYSRAYLSRKLSGETCTGDFVATVCKRLSLKPEVLFECKPIEKDTRAKYRKFQSTPDYARTA